jgi:hypothetical protein
MVRKKSRDQDGHREDEASNLFSEIAIVLEIDETFFSARSEIPSPSSHLNEPRCEHPTSSSAPSLPIPLLIGPSHRSSAYSHPKGFSDPTYNSIAIQPRMPEPHRHHAASPKPGNSQKKKDKGRRRNFPPESIIGRSGTTQAHMLLLTAKKISMVFESPLSWQSRFHSTGAH